MTMPNFLIIGAPKCGTTSLFYYLRQHPQIYMCRPKEPQFFEFGEAEQHPLEFPARPWAKQTLKDYQALFAKVTSEKAIGEATPSNFYPRACARIHAYLPEAKFVCILRQPVKRAYAVFWALRYQGKEYASDFSKAYENQCWLSPSDLKAAWYIIRLQDWLKRFPRHQFHFGLTDDLSVRPADYMKSIYEFLGVDDTFQSNVSRQYNQGSGFHSEMLNRFILNNMVATHPHKVPIPEFVRRTLKRFLRKINRKAIPELDSDLYRKLTLSQRDDILRLEELINVDLSCWLNV